MQTETPQTMSQPMDQDNLDAGHGSGGSAASPVDDATHNLLMALTSKLESIEVSAKHANGEDTDFWRRLGADDRRHADELLTKLKQRLAGA